MKNFPTSVELYDKHGNMFEVSVLKSSVDCYFTNGWSGLSEVYDLSDGGKIKMTVVRHDRLLIEVSNRLGINLQCHGPPKILRLNQQPSAPEENDSHYDRLDHSVYLGHNPILVYRLQKSLISQDITTDFLVCLLYFSIYLYLLLTLMTFILY